nr:MAK10-like protein [Tanacetum cinerariifolium]
MGDENPIRTLKDYSKSHEGYRNTIELTVRNNVVPLRSDTIRLVQNGCSFYGLRSKDPNQHLKDFLKLVDSPDLDVKNRERTRMTAKLRNDILMFQQHHRESLSEEWTRFKDLLQKVPYHGIDLWLQVKKIYDHVNPVIRRTIDLLADGKLRDLNAEESWALLKNLALYDNESWNDPRDFAKPVKVKTLPQDVPSTSDHRLIELETQVQRLMEAHLAPTQPTQVNKITTSCEICNGPHDTLYSWKTVNKPLLTTHPRVPMKQEAIIDQLEGTLPSDTIKNSKLGATLVLSARSYPTKDPQCSNHIHSSINAITIHPKQPEESQVNKPDVGQEEKDNLGNINSNLRSQHNLLASIATEQVRKVNSMLESLGLVPQSSNMKFVCSKENDGEVMFIEIIRDNDEPQNKSLNKGEGATTEGPTVEYIDTFPTRVELTYHKYLMCGSILSIFLQNLIITEGCPSNLKIPCNIGHAHAIIDQLEGTLPSDTIKNSKLGATLVLSARSYPTKDPQCSNHIHSSINAITIHPKQPEESQVNKPDVGQEEKDNLGNINSNLRSKHNLLASIATEQVRKVNSMLESLGLVPQSSNMKFVCSKENDGEVMFIEIIRDNDEPQNKSLNKGNFTYVVDFMIVEDISSIIDLRLSQVVLGRPFIKVSNITHDLPEGVVKFTNKNDEVAYKMPHKIE